MTEKEKMLSGALYNPNCGDPELSAEHARCAALCGRAPPWRMPLRPLARTHAAVSSPPGVFAGSA